LHHTDSVRGEAHIETASTTADDVLTVSEVARLLQLSPRTVAEYGARGLLPSVKIGRHRRFSRRQLEAMMAEGHTRATR
jgi:excisionase family DNA binding protein